MVLKDYAIYKIFNKLKLDIFLVIVIIFTFILTFILFDVK